MRPTPNGQHNETLFPLGIVAATPGVIAALELRGSLLFRLLHRHGRGDWGDLAEVDQAANEQALRTDAPLCSAYTLTEAQTRIFIITEGDRSSTSLLLEVER